MSPIQVSCKICMDEPQFSVDAQKHFDQCNSCNTKYKELLEKIESFNERFLPMLKWALYTTHLLEFKKNAQLWSAYPNDPHDFHYRQHQQYRDEHFETSFVMAKQYLSKVALNIVADIIEHILPNLKE